MKNAKEKKGIVSPKNINEMDDAAFEAYIKKAKKGEVQADTELANPAKNSEPYMVFETKEDMQEFLNKTIGGRLREIREMGDKEKSKLNGLYGLIKSRYKTSDTDEAVSKLISELTEQNAMDKGMTKGEYELMSELRKIRDEKNYYKQVEEIQNEWKRQEQALKNIIPDFDLAEAFENPEFYNAVVEEKKQLAEAYPFLNKRQPSYNISEIGNLTNGVSGHIKHDVNSMSDKEFEEYIRKLKNA